LVVKDMLFGREPEQLIYASKNTNPRADGFCKINDNAFCSGYLNETDFSNGYCIATTIDPITKVMTVGTPQELANFEIIEIRCAYLSDNKVCFVYVKDSNKIIWCRVATISGTVFTFGTAFALHSIAYDSQSIEIAAVDATHVAVLFTEQTDSAADDHVKAVVFSILGTTLVAIGNILEIDFPDSQYVDEADISISAFNSSSVGIVWVNNATFIAYTVKLNLSAVTLSMTQTPLELPFENADVFVPDAYPGIGCLTTNIAVVGFTHDVSTSIKQKLCMIDYSGSIPVITDCIAYDLGEQVMWRFAVISRSSFIVFLDYRMGANIIKPKVYNIYGDKMICNYSLTDAYFNDQLGFSMFQLNKGELISVSAIFTDIAKPNASLISFMGGVSFPDYDDYGTTTDLGIVDVDDYVKTEITLINDGIYPEDIDFSCSDLYFNDDDDLLSRSASIRVRSISLITDYNYDYLTDPKGNVLTAIL